MTFSILQLPVIAEKNKQTMKVYTFYQLTKWKNLKLFQMYFSSEITVVAYLILW